MLNDETERRAYCYIRKYVTSWKEASLWSWCRSTAMPFTAFVYATQRGRDVSAKSDS